MFKMKSISKICVSAFCVVLALISVPPNVLANDTEVFFPPQQVDPNFKPANPNILFVIDTSGSMGTTDSGQTQSRIKNVQDALKSILQDMNQNVNVGLMRFNGLVGGPVLFPVSPIDAYVDTIDVTGTGDRILASRITTGASEASQNSAGAVTVSSTSGISLDSNNLYMGLRFANVKVPQGVAITGAQITLYTNSAFSGTSAAIKIENSADAAAYTGANNELTSRTYNATALTWAIPASSKQYDNVDTSAAVNGTSKLKDLVNTVIRDNTGWCGGNALAFRFDRTAGTSTFVTSATTGTPSSDPNASGVSDYSAVLTLTYSPSDPKLATGCNKNKLASQVANQNDDSSQISTGATAPACAVLYMNITASSAVSGCGGNKKTTTVGVRFANLNIPQGATINSAVIDFTPYATDSNAVSLTINAENAVDAASYSSSNNDLSGRSSNPGFVSSSVTWATTAWASTSTVQTTPELKTLVQAVVNRTDWSASSNTLSFIITGPGGTGLQKAAYSFDGSASKAPRLRIEIAGPSGRQTVRQYLLDLTDSLVAYGGTPSMGTLYEAARYYRGEAAFYGRTRSYGYTTPSSVTSGAPTSSTSVRYPGSTSSNIAIDSSSNDYAAASRITHRAAFDYSKGTPTRELPPGCSDVNLSSRNCDGESWTGTAIYKSPITDGCQSNNIVFLSDGIPNVTTSSSPTSPTSSAADLIKSLTGKSECVVPTDTTRTEWQCGNELTSYLFTKDQTTAFGGTQNIRTYTIAFGPFSGSDAAGAEFLSQLAANGGGQSFAAASASDLTDVFKTIVGNILDINTTFVAPAVTVNTFNRLSNRNELYFALFKPTTGVIWPGNLKRYQLLQKTTDSTVRIYDNTASGSGGPLPAVDDSTGFFSDGQPTASPPVPKPKSFWSTIPDGANVAAGGAASVMPAPASRKTYTYVSSTAPSNVNLTNSNNYLVDENNALITKTLLGSAFMSDTRRTSILQWARGVDVLDSDADGSATDSRTQLGDPLHSEPQLVNYGGTDASPDIAIAMGTNDGGFHLFNAATGVEYFSFIPQELLANLSPFYSNSGSYLTRPNGMDGPITAWVNDVNGNGKILDSNGNPENNEFAYLYAGMRRGGNINDSSNRGSYFAFDVTNRNSPILKFQIKGGAGDYIELGQTWSRAIKKKIRIAGNNKDVLIFTGGYDPNVDNQLGGAVAPSSQGRALYVADASTGALLWWAGFNDPSWTVHPNLTVSTMTYSVPGSPLPMDMDNDGYVDRIYIADTGGQIFRFILGNDSSNKPSLSNATVQRIATLAGTDVVSARRFYSGPEVALITVDSSPYLAIAIGSGYREHPLAAENEDRFYILRDPDITNTSPSTFSINGDGDLYDATSNDLGSTNSTTKSTAATALASKKGLYIRLVEGTSTLKGEKVIAEPLIFNNQVLFATYQPTKDSDSQCRVAQGQSRSYQINVTNATPVYPNVSTSGSPLVKADRSRVLHQAGLPPAPTILFPSISSTLTNNSDGTQTRTVCTGSTCLPDQALLCIGAECFQPSLTLETIKAFWQKVEN